MKTSITVFALFLTVSILIIQSFYQQAYTNVSGAPAGRAASPFDAGGATCNASGCHTSYPLGSRPGWITSNIPGSGYVAGQTYTMTATPVSSSSCVRFGFEITAQTSTGATAGTIIITNATTTKLTSPPNTRWITHTLTGTNAAATPGTKTWSFNWTAPVSGTGTVTFYGAFNRANNSGTSLQDSIFTSQLVVPENPTGFWDLESSDFLLHVYPVPASEYVLINIKLRNNLLPEIQLTDISGKVIRHIADAATSSAQEYTYDINIADLTTGIYFIRMIQDSAVTVRKIVIL
jgi:hypothetical protein